MGIDAQIQLVQKRYYDGYEIETRSGRFRTPSAYFDEPDQIWPAGAPVWDLVRILFASRSGSRMRSDRLPRRWGLTSITHLTW